MLVRLSAKCNDLTIHKAGGSLYMKPGIDYELSSQQISEFIAQGLVVRSVYPMLLNNELGVFDGENGLIQPLTDYIRRIPVGGAK